jgi:EAL domain-containing protein (putative c-di-GMP-specific phosphodiesterase class I)
LRTLTRLKELGVTIAIDDFGTGYSSLSTLRSFPFDRIKIDRQFVAGMIQNPDDAAIVKAVLALAHAMNLQAVAEGVETEDQGTLLRLLGCDHFQGYLFGKPLPISEYAKLIGRSPAVRGALLDRLAIGGPRLKRRVGEKLK